MVIRILANHIGKEHFQLTKVIVTKPSVSENLIDKDGITALTISVILCAEAAGKLWGSYGQKNMQVGIKNALIYK